MFADRLVARGKGIGRCAHHGVVRFDDGSGAARRHRKPGQHVCALAKVVLRAPAAMPLLGTVDTDGEPVRTVLRAHQGYGTVPERIPVTVPGRPARRAEVRVRHHTGHGVFGRNVKRPAARSGREPDHRALAVQIVVQLSATAHRAVAVDVHGLQVARRTHNDVAAVHSFRFPGRVVGHVGRPVVVRVEHSTHPGARRHPQPRHDLAHSQRNAHRQFRHAAVRHWLVARVTAGLAPVQFHIGVQHSHNFAEDTKFLKPRQHGQNTDHGGHVSINT